MPAEASTYALPPEYAARGVRRYGFHGLSCESIVRQLKRAGDVPRRMVIAHLGSGCSVTALVDGRSVDTTMGLTPTGGVVMGTRPGDLDPGLVLYLVAGRQGRAGGGCGGAAESSVGASGVERDGERREGDPRGGGDECARDAGSEDFYPQCDEGDGRIQLAARRPGRDRICGRNRRARPRRRGRRSWEGWGRLV